MTSIKKNCKVSGRSFVVEDYDQAFYKKIGVPVPTLCFEERLKRKMRWRNERNLHHRECDLCKSKIISIYRADSPYTIYCPKCWWSDKWNSLELGQDIDWDRPFFDQMYELQLRVPRLSLYQKANENCAFTNHSANSRDCYLSTDLFGAQDVYHTKWAIKSRDLIDCYSTDQVELGYEIQYMEPGYNTKFAYLCVNVSDSNFMYNCMSVKNSFMCNNLVRKEYCIRNEFVGKEAYEAFMAFIDLGSYRQLEELKKEYVEMIRTAPKRQSLVHMCEECTGDALDRCKNVYDCYEMVESQDCRYCVINVNLKDCFDTYESAFHCERQYECHGCNNGQFIRFGHISYDNHECDIIDSCHNSSQLFGCVSVRRKKYCILNKQYSEDEYKALVPRLIKLMEEHEEWGEFFPSKYSPFSYEESAAQEYFSKAVEKQKSPPNAVELPDNIKETPDEITLQVLSCEASGEAYKFIPQELALHRKLGVALPRRSPRQRYFDRLMMRPKFELHHRSCSRCKKDICTTFSKEEPAPIYCHECYIETFH
jgi:hypothetical protein